MEETHLEGLGADGGMLLEWILEKWSGKVWIGFIWLRIGRPAFGSCGHVNEPSDFIKGREFDYLSDC
jgi:hypothetical protein